MPVVLLCVAISDEAARANFLSSARAILPTISSTETIHPDCWLLALDKDLLALSALVVAANKNKLPHKAFLLLEQPILISGHPTVGQQS